MLVEWKGVHVNSRILSPDFSQTEKGEVVTGPKKVIFGKCPNNRVQVLWLSKLPNFSELQFFQGTRCKIMISTAQESLKEQQAMMHVENGTGPGSQ